MRLTQRAALALGKYRKALPTNELRALARWTGTFWPFQQDWLFDDSRFAFLNKSRKIGFSHTTAGTCTLWGVFHGQTTTIISLGDREAKEVLDLSAKLARLLRELGSRNAVTTKETDHELRFASGGRILALPGSGGRSYSGNVFLDEYAYHQHADLVWDAAAPVITLGYRIRVVSTPNGVGNDFHNLYEIASGKRRNDERGRAGHTWSFHEVSIERAIADGYRVDIDDCWTLAKGDPRIFDQMFNCSFLDNELQYIPTDAIASCSNDTDLLDILGSTIPGEHYGGLDIGREADRTVLIVLRVIRGRRYVVHVESMKRTDSDGLEAMVARAFERYKLRRLCIDSTGLGTFPAERIKKKHSERIDVAHRRPRVECVDFTPNSKEDLATGLYACMTGKVVVIPKTDAGLPDCPAGTAAALRQDIAAIRRIVTNSGNIRYDAPRTASGHADHAWALALGLHACSTPNPMVEALNKRAGAA